MLSRFVPARWRRPSAPQPARRATPRLEALEARDCPTLTITTFNIVPVAGAGRQVEVRGTVQDDLSNQVTIKIGGVALGSASVALDGTFDVQLPAVATGTVTGIAFDDWSQCSATAAVLIDVPPPVVTNFRAVRADAGRWTFSGQVSDLNPNGVTVQLGGLPDLVNQSVQTNSLGQFSLTIALSRTGQASAQATDCWDMISDTQTCLVS
jgi:hypothetical protein